MAGWGGYGDKKGAGGMGFVMEGKVPIYQFTEAPTRVRFLTQDVSVEDVMSTMGFVREQAEDYINTKLINEKWIMPVARWEHSIKEIPGKRFFATVVCLGKGRCPLCAENDVAKNNGVTENKLLPYGVRKRFFVPAYVYDMKRVLFVRGAEDFFDDVASYVNKKGPNADFEIWKVGKGFNTKYKSTFIDVGDPLEVDWSSIAAPKDLDFNLDESEWKRRVEGGPGARSSGASEPQAGPAPARIAASASAVPPSAPEKTPEYAVPAGSGPTAVAAKVDGAADFVVPFGSHKGKTLKQLYDLGEEDYVRFLSTQAAGLVQEKARAFLAEVK